MKAAPIDFLLLDAFLFQNASGEATPATPVVVLRTGQHERRAHFNNAGSISFEAVVGRVSGLVVYERGRDLEAPWLFFSGWYPRRLAGSDRMNFPFTGTGGTLTFYVPEVAALAAKHFDPTLRGCRSTS